MFTRKVKQGMNQVSQILCFLHRFVWVALVRRIVSSYSGISKYFLLDQRSITAHSGAYVRLMMMKSWRKRCRNTYRNLGFGALVFVPVMVGAQENRASLEGTIREASTHAPVAWANVVLSKGEDPKLATTDSNGYFQFQNIPFGTYNLTISYVGFQTLTIRELAVEHQYNSPLEITLEPSGLLIDEIVVKADQPLSQTARLSGGYILTPEEVRRYPATFYDPARLATVYPGILNVNDQANNLTIRGNSPNQMNFYIHGAEIVNSNHLANAGTSTDRTTLSGGSVNMFSAQLLQNTEIFTGVIPVDLLQSTSGAMNYDLKRGSRSDFHFTGQAGLNGIDLAVEGPMGERWSYIANYRYSTVGLLSQLGVDFSDETILYQDLSLQASYYQNERVTWQFFAMGGDNSNTFRAKEDSLREEYKDLFDIDFKSRIGIAGGNVQVRLSDDVEWNTTLVASTRWDKREEFSDLIPASYSEDDLELTKYALNSGFQQDVSSSVRLKYGLNATFWAGGLEYLVENISEAETQFSVNSHILRPYIEGQWTRDLWQWSGGLGLSYSGLSDDLNIQPKLGIIRHFPGQQRLALNSGLQHKLQPYQILLTSASNSQLRMMQSWKSTLTYEKNFKNSVLKTTAFYEAIDHVAASEEGFSALNILEEYPPSRLSDEGNGLNYGLELAFQHYLNHGFFYMVSGSLFDAKFKTPGLEGWTNSHYNNQYIVNTTIGKEFDFSTTEKQKVLGINFQLVYAGGFWETPIDLTESRAAQRTVRSTSDPFSIHLPDVLKTYFRVYYKINHSKRYSLIGLDLSNVLNRDNISHRYFDPYLDQVVDKYQLGLIPMLSYVIRI